MVINLRFKSLIAVALLSGFSGFAAADAESIAENDSLVPEVTAAEATISFRDMPYLSKAFIGT